MAKCGWLRSWQICEESQRRRLQRDIVSQHHFGCPLPLSGEGSEECLVAYHEPPMDYGRSMASPFCPWADHVKRPTLDLGGSPQVAWGLLGRSGLFSWPLISVANDDATTATASCQGSLVLHVIHRCVSEGPVYGDTMPLCYNMLCTSHCPVCSLFVPMFLFFWKVATALSPNISSRGIGFSVFYSDVSFSQALSPRFVWQIVPLACVAKIKI